MLPGLHNLRLSKCLVSGFDFMSMDTDRFAKNMSEQTHVAAAVVDSQQRPKFVRHFVLSVQP